MDLAQIIQNIKDISKVLEKLSKRLRRVEVLSRLAQVEQVDTFLDLADTPDSYAGMYGWVPKINNLENGLEFLPVGGGACVAFTCGPVGWRAVGGTDPRTLVHEVAFQLSPDGNDRGHYAIDLQQNQFNATYVAAAPHSAILSDEQNKIESDCDYSVTAGPWNEITAASELNSAIGYYNLINASYANGVLGGDNSLDGSTYNSVLGYDHVLNGTFGCFVFGEQNYAHANVNDYPTYSVSGGILNTLSGDCFLVFQWGESNKIFGLGSAVDEIVLWSTQFGFRNYAQNVITNHQFGQSTKSFLSNADAAGEYYNGRILNSGDYENDHPSDGTGEVGGFNQGSWFSQSDVITTWNVAWTTGRFEFPIIQDSIWTFTILISMTEKGCVNSHSFKIEGVIENDGANTTMLASTVTNIYRDVGTKEVQAVADNANDRLAIQYRDTGGPDATWTNVQFSMMTVEVGAEI